MLFIKIIQNSHLTACFIIINDLHQTIEKSSIHHFADDANLLLIDKSPKKKNKYINRDLKCAVDWTRANKYPLTPAKPKIDNFKQEIKLYPNI